MCLHAVPRVLWFVPRARAGPRRPPRTPRRWHAAARPLCQLGHQSAVPPSPGSRCRWPSAARNAREGPRSSRSDRSRVCPAVAYQRKREIV